MAEAVEPDGTNEGPLTAGDRVWWDEGAKIGYIRQVLAAYARDNDLHGKIKTHINCN